MRFGAYGILLIVFGLFGALGVKKNNVLFVQIISLQNFPLYNINVLFFDLLHFFLWKIFSIALIIAMVAGVILMVVFDTMPEINSLWLSIVVIGVLGLVFALWSVSIQ